MITGDPEAVETAARSLSTAGTGFTETGETVGHHASTLDANWSGSASGAATQAITRLSQRIGSGGPPCTSIHDALVTYAQALREAQREWAAAHATATAGESALNDAKAEQIRARALPTAQDDPHTGPVVSSPAIRAADTARTNAADSVAAAKTAMADAVAKLAQANQAAAAVVDAATEALADMGGTGAPEGGPAEAIREGRARRADEARVDAQQPDGFGDTVKNVVGGAGDGAWKVGPGAAGWLFGFVPVVGDDIEATVEGWHDDLERGFGADTDSLAYRGTSGGVQVASLLIPGMGVIKAGRVIGAARDIRALGVVGSAAKAAGALRAAPAAVRAASAAAVRDGVRAVRMVGGVAPFTVPAAVKTTAEVAFTRPWREWTRASWRPLFEKRLDVHGPQIAGAYVRNGYREQFVDTMRRYHKIPEGEVSLAMPPAGTTMDRYFGSQGDSFGMMEKGSLPWGVGWTSSDVRGAENLRSPLGLPNENPVRFGASVELVRPEYVFHVRRALPLHGYPGGAVEYMVFDPERAVVVRHVFGVNEAFTHGSEPFVKGWGAPR